MALLRRQDVSTTWIDDQSQTLLSKYLGNWTRYYLDQDYNDGTYTSTPNAGASLSFAFTGYQIWVYGGLTNNSTSPDGTFLYYPTANYFVDGSPVGPQVPYLDVYKRIIYYQSQTLGNGPHTINFTVTRANLTNQFIFDCFSFNSQPDESGSGAQSSLTQSSTPTSTTTQSGQASLSRVGSIVGIVAGTIVGIAIFVIAVYYFLRRNRRVEDVNYPETADTRGILDSEYRPEPFNPHAASPSPSSPGFSGQVSQPTTSGGAFDWTLDQSSMQNPTSSSPPPLHLSDNMTQVRTGKAALMAQQYQNAPQSTQHMDFGENGEQEPRLLRLPSVSPPSYTHR